MVTYNKVCFAVFVSLVLASCQMTPEERATKMEDVQAKYSHISDLGLCLRHLEQGGTGNKYWMGEEIERRKVDCYTFEQYLEYKKYRQERRRKLQNELMNYGKSSNVTIKVE